MDLLGTSASINQHLPTPTANYSRSPPYSHFLGSQRRLDASLCASLSRGCFPSEWKEANVTPVPKVGDRQMVNHYRPVSDLIPVIAKLFESLSTTSYMAT